MDEIENKMYELAVELINKRYPTGWGGVGVVHTENGNYYTSVALENANASAGLCIETGAMLEACKYNERITHCMCLVRENESAEYVILSPCGICQERLSYWPNVKVAVTTKKEKLLFVDLNEMRPYAWTNAYDRDELEFWRK